MFRVALQKLIAFFVVCGKKTLAVIHFLYKKILFFLSFVLKVCWKFGFQKPVPFLVFGVKKVFVTIYLFFLLFLTTIFFIWYTFQFILQKLTSFVTTHGKKRFSAIHFLYRRIISFFIICSFFFYSALKVCWKFTFQKPTSFLLTYGKKGFIAISKKILSCFVICFSFLSSVLKICWKFTFQKPTSFLLTCIKKGFATIYLLFLLFLTTVFFIWHIFQVTLQNFKKVFFWVKKTSRHLLTTFIFFALVAGTLLLLFLNKKTIVLGNNLANSEYFVIVVIVLAVVLFLYLLFFLSFAGLYISVFTALFVSLVLFVFSNWGSIQFDFFAIVLIIFFTSFGMIWQTSFFLSFKDNTWQKTSLTQIWRLIWKKHWFILKFYLIIFVFAWVFFLFGDLGNTLLGWLSISVERNFFSPLGRLMLLLLFLSFAVHFLLFLFSTFLVFWLSDFFSRKHLLKFPIPFLTRSVFATTKVTGLKEKPEYSTLKVCWKFTFQKPTSFLLTYIKKGFATIYLLFLLFLTTIFFIWHTFQVVLQKPTSFVPAHSKKRFTVVCFLYKKILFFLSFPLKVCWKFTFQKPTSFLLTYIKKGFATISKKILSCFVICFSFLSSVLKICWGFTFQKPLALFVFGVKKVFATIYLLFLLFLTTIFFGWHIFQVILQKSIFSLVFCSRKIFFSIHFLGRKIMIFFALCLPLLKKTKTSSDVLQVEQKTFSLFSVNKNNINYLVLWLPLLFVLFTFVLFFLFLNPYVLFFQKNYFLWEKKDLSVDPLTNYYDKEAFWQYLFWEVEAPKLAKGLKELEFNNFRTAPIITDNGKWVYGLELFEEPSFELKKFLWANGFEETTIFKQYLLMLWFDGFWFLIIWVTAIGLMVITFAVFFGLEYGLDFLLFHPLRLFSILFYFVFFASGINGTFLKLLLPLVLLDCSFSSLFYNRQYLQKQKIDSSSAFKNSSKTSFYIFLFLILISGWSVSYLLLGYSLLFLLPNFLTFLVVFAVFFSVSSVFLNSLTKYKKLIWSKYKKNLFRIYSVNQNETLVVGLND